MATLLVLALLLLVGMGVAVYVLTRPRTPTDAEVLARMQAAVAGFTVTERHAHEGTGLLADEEHGKIAVLGTGQPKIALLTAKDLMEWRYRAEDDHFRMTIRSRRHPTPFEVTFRKERTANEWLKIFRKITEEF